MRHDPRASRRCTRRAFSLVELLIVITILGTVTAIAMPRFAEAKLRYQSQLTARRLAGELERARAHARANSMPVTVLVAASSNTCIIKDQSNTTLSSFTLGRDHEATIESAVFGNGSTLQFDGFGKPLRPGTVTVRAGRWYSTVSVAADTGVVSISKTPSTLP